MQFHMLGPLRVTDAHGRELKLAGARISALLALLLLRPNEVVPADRLIEDLWEGKPPPTAAKTLQVYVSRLRAALGQQDLDGPLRTGPGGYILRVTPADVDALRFEQLVAEGSAALAEGSHERAAKLMRSALELWRGEPLAGFTYASFAQDPIARLEALRVVALQSAVEAELALGRHAELIPELEQLVRHDPLNEHVRAQLMLALYRDGRQAEALGVYRAGRRLLVNELGIEPGDELRGLERAILAQDPSLAGKTDDARSQPSSNGTLYVGYASELGALARALDDALAGRGRTALIAGEPGIGKTRLAEEAGRLAIARGAEVVWGRAWEAGRTPPYWPWLRILRTLGDTRDTPRPPALAELLAERPGTSAGGPVPFRIFEATATYLRDTSRARPLVIVLDDLHAADPSSLALLQFVATELADSYLLVIGTYRDTEAGLSHPLMAALATLSRTGECVQLVLTGIASAATRTWLEVGASGEPLPALARAVHEETAGNPLFVGELTRLLRAEGRLRELEPGEDLVLPHGIEQVIAHRLEHLSDQCRRVLEVASVIGREFDLRLVERVTESGADELLEALDDAHAHRVVEGSTAHAGSYRFSHDLVRQVLYSGLAAPERCAAHLAVARALEETGAGTSVALLAHHYDAALPVGDAAKAIEYLELAGDAAAALSANQEAAGCYERAAVVARENRVEHPARGDLELKLAEQLILIPDAARAGVAAANAEKLLDGACDDARRGRLAIVRALHDIVVGSTANGVESIRDAIALFEGLGDPANEARARWALFMWEFVACGQFTAAEATARRMLACAEEAGARELKAQAIRALASALGRVPMPASAAAARLRALLPAAPDAATEARILVALGDVEAARANFSEGRALIARARELLMPAQLEEVDWSGATLLAQLELFAGNPVAAEELARGECNRDQARGAMGYLASDLTYLVTALIDQGRLNEAEEELERAELSVTSHDADALLRQARCRGMLALARDDRFAAECWVRVALKEGERLESPELRAESLLLLARVLDAAGRADEARVAADEALELSAAREHEVFAARARRFLEKPASRAA